MLVEEHPDQERERVVGEERVGGGVSGDVKVGHVFSLPVRSARCPGVPRRSVLLPTNARRDH